MKLLQVKSNETLPVVIRQGNSAIVHCNERPYTTISNEQTIEGFEYDGVVVEDGISYTDQALVEIANRDLAQAYLDETDWIVVKINEYQVRGKAIDELLEKYAEQLDKREAARLLA